LRDSVATVEIKGSHCWATMTSGHTGCLAPYGKDDRHKTDTVDS